MANKFVKIIRPVTVGASIVEDGLLELDEVSANSLIAEGLAEETDETPATQGGDDNTDVNAQNGANNDPKPLDDTLLAQGANNPADDNVALMRKALDDRYKRDELAEAAKAIGVEFKFDAKKAEIIEAIILAEKAEVLVQAQ